MAILTSAEYPAIRAALDVDLNDKDLPDSTIALTIYQDAADQDVLDIDPDAEGRTGDEAAAVTRAAIYFCAARLAYAVVRITSLSVNTRDISYSKATFDPEERAAQLRAEAEEELAEILEPEEEAPRRPTMFSRATGSRGQ